MISYSSVNRFIESTIPSYEAKPKEDISLRLGAYVQSSIRWYGLVALGIIETKNLIVLGTLCYFEFKKDFDGCDNNDDNNCPKNTTGPAPPDCGTCGLDIRRRSNE